MDKPPVHDIIALGISRTHAYDILAGREPPSLPLAIHIYRKTGWKSDPVVGLSEQTIEELEAREPWTKAA